MSSSNLSELASQCERPFPGCAGFNAYYVGETLNYFSTRVREHLVSDKASHISKHLQDSEHYRAFCSADSFHDHASTGFQHKIKGAVHIQREEPLCSATTHPL